MNNRPFILLACLLILPLGAPLAEEMEINTEKDKFSYVMGAIMSRGVAQNLEIELIDIDIFLLAVEDVLRNRESRMSDEEIDATFKKAEGKLAKSMEKKISDMQQAGKDFLKQNAQKEGVTTTDSGLQYHIVQEGSGAKPQKNSVVSVHYEGRLVNGGVFDSSYQRGEPASFPVGNVIEGWQEALQLMSVGSTWEVAIPSQLAYGERGAGTIPPNSTLLFKIELLSIKP
ncbi:MAG: FKBP-type peptidyl-prolyl cis-trans isomerase [Candidatus Eutrophobiaceae bacterium]